ncbi:MAG: thiamine pyrophosphate-dependent enzyme, partial [Actinomycetota bacterium]
MPKTATRQKQETKTTKTSANGSLKTAADNPAGTENPAVDVYDVKEAQTEFNKRRKSQIGAIKKLDKEFLGEMLYEMIFGRLFERKCAEVYRMGKIGGFCHLYIGQEAIAVGSMTALKEGDYVVTSYRDHVQAMIAGIAPEAVMAELFGKATGNVGGKGGSMHMFS